MSLDQAQLLFLCACFIVCLFPFIPIPCFHSPFSLGHHCDVLNVYLFVLCFCKIHGVYMCPCIFKLCKLMLYVSLFLTFIFEYMYLRSLQCCPVCTSNLCLVAASTLWCVIITRPLSTLEAFCIFIPNAYDNRFFLTAR